MSHLFPNLFSPLEIRGKRFKNRLFLPAHGTGYADSGTVGDRGFAYYEARVSRGIGALITEASQVVPVEGQHYAQLSFASDDAIPRVKRLVEVCALHDCRYLVQLYHEGRARSHSRDGSLDVAIAPSAVPDERHHIMPRPMSVSMIEDLVDSFASAARRAWQAGADGVELLVGMGYLVAQFLSPRINIRDDVYGGDIEGRSRFLREILTAMRASTDDDFILGIRIAGEEYASEGLKLNDTIAACERLDSDKLVDFVNICAASSHNLAGASNIVPPMFVETGPTLQYAAAVRAAVNVPVLTAGRINQPQQAEQAIASGQADMVGMVRAFIADPEFALKASEDRVDDIRACIACNQACIGHRLNGFGVSCIQFPETGRELEYGTRNAAEQPKRVVVVGGGPGGMKTAAVAAERGHNVVLLERGNQVGGQALLAQRLPGREEFGGLVTNLERELRHFGVDIRTKPAASAESVASMRPDCVVIATGATPYRPPGNFEGAHVVDAWEVLQDRVNVGQSVVIADWRCDWVGLGLAEKLATEGCSVTLCVNGEMAGQSIQPYVRYVWVGRLHELGVRVTPYVRLFGADENTVYLQHVINDEAVLMEQTDTLVLATGHQSRLELHDALAGKVAEIHAVGDCLSPRTAEEAVLEGLKVGASI